MWSLIQISVQLNLLSYFGKYRNQYYRIDFFFFQTRNRIKRGKGQLIFHPDNWIKGFLTHKDV